jgi:predicted TIM-barrel fold metal-dependent hydrolase
MGRCELTALNDASDDIPQGIIDMHFHVGVRGDTTFNNLGHFSDDFMRDPVFNIFLFFGRLKKEELTDDRLFERMIEVLRSTRISKVVCLAMDHYFDPETGQPHAEKSKMWVSNKIITDYLRPELPDKILFGCSVNPYDRRGFRQRTLDCVSNGAVLMKWVPSVHGIDLADPYIGDAMKFLASAGKGGQPLPLLLHVGPEHSIPPPYPWMSTYDFLSWSMGDRILNIFQRCHRPRVKKIRANLEAALQAGTKIIFAHCGAPYYKLPWHKGFSEHSDFDAVANFLRRSDHGDFTGKCFADISAFVSPMRRPLFEEIKKLPPGSLLFGSDFPVPIIELSSGPKEWWDDLTNIIIKGEWWRVIVPEDNLLDVNYRELRRVFPDHPLFTNARALFATG